MIPDFLARNFVVRYFRRLTAPVSGLSGHEQRQVDWDKIDARILSIWDMVQKGFKRGAEGNKAVLVVGAIGVVFAALASASIPLLFRILPSILEGNFHDLQWIMEWLPLDDPLSSPHLSIWLVGSIVVLLGSLVVLRSIFDAAGSLSFLFFDRKITERYQYDLAKKLHGLDEVWLSSMHSGRLAQVIIGDVNSISQLVGLVYIAIPASLIRIAAMVGAMAYIDWRLTIVSLIALPIATLIQHFLSKKIRMRANRLRNAMGAMNREMIESVSFVRAARIFGRTEDQMRSIQAMVKNVTAKTMQASIFMPIQRVVVELCIGLGVGAVVLVLTYRNGSTGDLFGFFAALSLTLPHIRGLSGLHLTIQEAVVPCSRAFNVLAQNPDIVDTPDAKPLVLDRGGIQIRNLDFGYTEDKPIFKDFSIDILGGKTTAIVGPTGAGKSTLISLLLRFYDAKAGKIRIDGQDITRVTQDSLRSNMSVVTQDILVLDRTLRENIAYGRHNATDDEVKEAAYKAQLGNFIKSHPEGLDTLVGEKGIKLSGGEKQRLSIARALIKSAPILILDEATSSLDNLTERMIQKQLMKVSDKATRIVIAHRLSTIRAADNIIVLSEGAVVEQGTHEELIAAGGAYFGMQNVADLASESNENELRITDEVC